MSKPTVLIVLDGWGYSKDIKYNAIHTAHTPCWDKLLIEHPYTTLACDGQQVGLPTDQIGNSEVGHMTMGAGRVIYQDLARINNSIQTEEFFTNPIFNQAIDYAKNNHKNIHLIGLLSDGGVHSHEQHIFSLLDLCSRKNFNNIVIHAFLDGRDTPPKSATKNLEKLITHINNTKAGIIYSIAGRYYAMDRDKRYDRTKQTYDTLTDPNLALHSKYRAKDPITALQQAYARGETDEFVTPTIIDSSKNLQQYTITNGDVVIFSNFRADRAKQLSYALTDPNFSSFTRKVFPKLETFISFTNYAADINAKVAFPKPIIANSLGEILSKNKLSQLRLAETEKYAHVTFFFDGGVDVNLANSKKILVPSPKVTTYDLKPEMSALAVTEELITAINSKKYDFILCNYANADMVGHTGNFKAAISAVEVLDKCLAQIINSIKKTQSQAIITADHGNVELMYNEHNEQPHTAHSNNPVPCIYVGPKIAKINSNLLEPGLKDIAPTILKLLDIAQPPEISGRSIFDFT